MASVKLLAYDLGGSSKTALLSRRSLGDMTKCGASKDVVIEAALSLEVCGLPVARMGDGMAHGGTIIMGSGSLIIGGPTFKLPANITIDGTPEFQNAAIRDLFFIWKTPSGKELFKRLEAADENVIIIETLEENGRCEPFREDEAMAKQPGGSTVKYNPNFYNTVVDEQGYLIPNPPQATFFHELVHALHFSEGKMEYDPSKVDPAPPKLQPDLLEREAQSIGIGSHKNDYPTENSFRDDLGVDRRGNHVHGKGLDPTDPSYYDFRPGSC